MKKTLNKRIFAIITLIFVAICSIMPFTLRNNRVYADEIDTNSISPPSTFSFTSPEYMLPFSTYVDGSWSDIYISYYFELYEDDITTNLFYFDPVINWKNAYVQSGLGSVTSPSFEIRFYKNNILLNIETFDSSTSDLSFDVSNSYDKYVITTNFASPGILNGTFSFVTTINSSLVSNDVVYGYRVYNTTHNGSLKHYSNDFTYFMLNGTIETGFVCSTNYFLLKDNTMFFANSNIGYQQGFDDGYSEGFDDGEDYANQTARDKYYQQGYDVGLEEGKIQGFNNGVASANEYSFLGLLGAVVDAPVQALTGLLNFEILGFNMFNLFKGLITLSIILFVVKLIL